MIEGVRPDVWQQYLPRFLFLEQAVHPAAGSGAGVDAVPADRVTTEQGTLLLHPRHAGMVYVARACVHVRVYVC